MLPAPASWWEGLRPAPASARMAWLEDQCGPVVALDDLAVGKARDFAAFLMTRDDVGAKLVELRQRDHVAWVIVDFENDVGQRPVVEIERVERVALGFQEQDHDWPIALVVRDDFPTNLSHTFLRPPGEPTALCLSEEPWAEAKRRWTPNLLVRTVRHWFAETAKGQLHHGDQALEPFVAASGYQAVLPANVEQLCEAPGSVLYGYLVPAAPDGPVKVVRFFGTPQPSAQPPRFAAALIQLPPQLHGFIRHSARHVADLVELLTVEGLDFKAKLTEIVRGWLERAELRDAQPILIVQIPMLRAIGGEVERTDTRLFMLDTPVRDLGVSLDIWTVAPGVKGPLIEGPNLFPGDPSFDGANVSVMLWSALTDITREAAAKFNGYAGASGREILVMGAGALGSQITGNLIRMGETISGIADNDLLLPHNLARHEVLNHNAIGLAKAVVAASFANNFLTTLPETASFIVDIVEPGGGDADAFRAALQKAPVLLDVAASVAVSRTLAIDVDSTGRRCAAFLSPSGRDLVVIVEDQDREARLDHLEMSYYAALCSDRALDGHLATKGHVRYGQSCRDLSGEIEQAHVAIHAGIAAKVLREAVSNPNALGGVWRIDPGTLQVARIELDVRPMLSFAIGEWTVLVRPQLLENLWELRRERLPAETGGVLLGDFDTSRKLIYLVDTLATPPDSKEDAGSFVRGAYGLPEALHTVEQRTQLMLRYAGEWHSHPTGYGVMPSGDDIGLYGFMADKMSVEGYPPIMLIVGDREFSLIVGGNRIPLDRPKAD